MAQWPRAPELGTEDLNCRILENDSTACGRRYIPRGKSEGTYAAHMIGASDMACRMISPSCDKECYFSAAKRDCRLSGQARQHICNLNA